MRSMNKEPIDPRLEAYLALCQRIVERLHREGTWPWPDEIGDQEDVTAREAKNDP